MDAGVTTLVLGSFPSPASLARGQYYGHPRNAFWPIMARITGEPLTSQPYPQRLRSLLAHRIGLWDVIDRCERAGALDADIRNARHNAFDPVLAVARGRVRVCFNGKTAGRLAPWFASRGYETVVLPSTSPAFTLPFEVKLARWRAAIEPATVACADAAESVSC
jgi:hypoxanthine-DNA glycosylase